MAEGYVPFPSFAGWVTTYDGSLVDEVTAQLQNARRAFGDVAADRAVEVASRYAAVDTGAIEGLYATSRGFTRTIAERSANWEAALKMHPEAEHHIWDALAGYEFVLDAVTQKHPITQAWIRDLHAVLCASQATHDVFVEVAGRLHREARPLPKGAYKTAPNFPTNPDTGAMHHYAPVDDTAAEMARLMDELTSQEFLDAHPLVQAAYAHYAFVCVHPFADGNGRVARALASVFLYRRPGIPLVIFADQTPAYLDVLAAADGGRPEAFVTFVEQRAIDAVNLVLAEVSSGGGSGAEIAAALHDDGRGGSSLPRIELLAGRLAGCIRDAVESSLPTLSLPPEIVLAVGRSGVGGPLPPGWGRFVDRSVPGGLGTRIDLSWSSAPSCSVWLQLDAAAREPQRGPRDPADQTLIAVAAAGSRGTDALWEVRPREIHPAISQAFELRVRAWVRGQLQQLSAELAERIREFPAEPGR